jgi:3-hydroxyisobutyrate dehydrogenase-like beta-hydroxyacid dehydrogenase
MAQNLVKAGFPVRAYDVRPEAVSALAGAGARAGASAGDAAKDADLLILMVVNAAEAEQVLFADGAVKALALAARMGVDPAVALRILSGSSAASWMLNDRGPRMLEDGPELTSAIDIFVKDLSIVMEAGREAKAPLPLASAAHQLFLATSGRGERSADDSQVIRTYRAMTGDG